MDYRAPLAGLERRLGDLEEELARLRALPPVARKGPPRKSKKERALEKRLAELDAALAKAGYRDLTERESTYLRRCAQGGVILVVSGLAIASLHLVVRSSVAMTWTATTCSIFAEEEDVHVARYVSRGREWEFSASGERRNVAPCWVPDPPAAGVGRLDPPRSPRVSLWEKLSWGWMLTAASALALGVLLFFAVRLETNNRRKGVFAADDFSSSD